LAGLLKNTLVLQAYTLLAGRLRTKWVKADTYSLTMDIRLGSPQASRMEGGNIFSSGIHYTQRSPSDSSGKVTYSLYLLYSAGDAGRNTQQAMHVARSVWIE